MDVHVAAAAAAAAADFVLEAASSWAINVSTRRVGNAVFWRTLAGGINHGLAVAFSRPLT